MLAASISCLTFISRAADWPQFRGNPALTGVAEGRLPDQPVLLWSFKTTNAVKSSAAIQGGHVFIGSDDGNLYALDFATGQKLWAVQTDGPVQSSPLVTEGKVFVGSDDGILRSLDAADGKLRWKYLTGDRIAGSPNLTRSPDGKRAWIIVGSFDGGLHRGRGDRQEQLGL